MKMGTKPISSVRDSGYAGIDDLRAMRAYTRLLSAAEQVTNRVTLTSAEAADIAAMLESNEYANHIAECHRMATT